MPFDVVGVGHHGAQLVDLDRQAVAPHAALLVEGEAGVVEVDEPAHDGGRDGAADDRACGEGDVEAALEHVVGVGVPGAGDGHALVCVVGAG